MEESTKKKSRKIRCTQEFNQLNRTSLIASSSKSENTENSVTKKKKNLSYLPKICFNDEPMKENCSPNMVDKNLTNKPKKKSKAYSKQITENIEMEKCSIGGTSTEEDTRESEFEFKKKKKKRKQKTKQKSSSDSLSDNEINSKYALDNTVEKSTSVKLNLQDLNLSAKKDLTKISKNFKRSISRTHNSLNGHESKSKEESSSDILSENETNHQYELEKSASVNLNLQDQNISVKKNLTKKSINMTIKSRRSMSRTPKSLKRLGPKSNIETSSDVMSGNETYNKSELEASNNLVSKSKSLFSRTSKSLIGDEEYNTKKSKNSAVHHSRIHTSDSLALTPNSDELSDEVFGEGVNMDATLEIYRGKCELKQENSEEIFKFDHFELEDINKSSNTEGNKRSVRFTKSRLSKSLDDCFNKSTLTTPGKNDLFKIDRTKKSVLKSTTSLNSSNKRSVSFVSLDCRYSKSSNEGEHSKIFPKSPHISKVSKTTSLSGKKGTPNYSGFLDETDVFQNESSPTPQKCSNFRKPTMSDKKSVSFFTPVNNKNDFKTTSFKKSPYVRRSTLDVTSSSDSSQNKTFELLSPTIEQETLKHKSILTSPTSTFPEKISTFSPIKCTVDIVTSSPQSEHDKTKSTDGFSFILQNLSEDDNKNAGSSDGCKSNMKVTKRKKWNRSLGVSIIDNEGMLHNISSPWEKDTNFSQSINVQNYSRSTSISPIKKVNSAVKCLPTESSSTKKPIKKIQECLEKSSNEPGPKTAIAETVKAVLSPKREDEPSNSSLRFEFKTSTSKTKNKVVKRTKLPNFALIHQKAYDKLEDVKEMSQRKAARAQQLLSGKKPGSDTNIKIPSSNLKVQSPTLKIKSPKSRKLLRYSPKKQQQSGVKQKLQSPNSTSTIKKTQTQIMPSTSDNKKISKPVVKKLVKSSIPKPIHVDKKPLSKLGFKVESTGNNKVLRKEHLKAAVNKTRPERNSIEARRNVLQNVRTNRRFELLMKMRKKDS